MFCRRSLTDLCVNFCIYCANIFFPLLVFPMTGRHIDIHIYPFGFIINNFIYKKRWIILKMQPGKFLSKPGDIFLTFFDCLLTCLRKQFESLFLKNNFREMKQRLIFSRTCFCLTQNGGLVINFDRKQTDRRDHLQTPSLIKSTLFGTRT